MRLKHATVAAVAGLVLLGASPAPLIGTWGSKEATLVVGPAGGRLEQGCALVMFDAVRPDGNGRFTIDARVARLSALPPDDSADEDVAQRQDTRPASLSGEVRGNVLVLELAAANDAPRRLSLTAGQRAKPSRCL